MRYVLITSIPYALNPNGTYAVDRLWGWDLQAHLEVFNDLHILAPLNRYDKEKFPYAFPAKTIVFHPLPNYNGVIQFCKRLPHIVDIIIKAIHENDIVHSTGSAYPPLGLISNIIFLLNGCSRRIIVFDADFIRDIELMISSERKPAKKVYLFILKKTISFFSLFCIKHSQLTFVVGEALCNKYQNYGNVVKIYASWVKESDIIPPYCLKRKLGNSRDSNIIKLCFAASLVSKKNPVLAIETARILKKIKIPFTLDIFGDGPQKEELKRLVERYNLSDCIDFKGLVPYGEQFYSRLREYDAILIPNLSGEQPRIIFDAMANGVAVIGSNLESFSVISSGNNGFLCSPQDPQDFAHSVIKLYNNRELLEKIIFTAIETVKENTIESMHKKRKQIILREFLK